MFELAVIIVLVVLNGLFVASEFATVVAPRASMEARAQGGDKKALELSRILKDPSLVDRYIASSQVGITAASLGLGMYGEKVIADWLIHYVKTANLFEEAASHVIASAISVTALTYMHIVFGEMIPKSLALQKSESVMLTLVTPMSLFMKLFGPLIALLNDTNNAILKNLFGIDRSKSVAAVLTSEELEFIVKESETEGIISDEISTVIERIFDFGELKAEDVMVPRVHMVALPMVPEADELRARLKEHSYARFPVYRTDKDDIVGSVHIKDLSRILDSKESFSLLVRPLPYVPHSANLQTVLESMRQHSTHMAIVLDEHGGTAGMITMQDIFDEVIGDIDESLSHLSMAPLPDGSLAVSGTVRLSELSERLEITLEDDNVSTISGLVLDQLQRPPKVGDKIAYGLVSVEVIKIKGRGVQMCKVKKLADKE